MGFVRQCIDRLFEHLPSSERDALARQWSALQRNEAAALVGEGRPSDFTGTRAVFSMLERASITWRDSGYDAHRDTAVALLQAMANDTEFRDACYAQAELASADCEDNAQVQFERLCLQLPFQHAHTVEAFVKAARGVAATGLLQDFVDLRYPKADEALEICQWLKVKLSQRLGLPESRMLFTDTAKRQMGTNPERVVGDAHQHVRRHLEQRMTRTLLDTPLWETWLTTHYRDEIDACTAPAQQGLEAVMESEMTSDRAFARATGMNNIFRNAEARALEVLTKACVEAGAADPKSNNLRTMIRNLLPRHGRTPDTMDKRVQAKLDSSAELRRIQRDAEAEAGRWQDQSLMLLQTGWGRLAGPTDDPGRADPIGHRFHGAAPAADPLPEEVHETARADSTEANVVPQFAARRRTVELHQAAMREQSAASWSGPAKQVSVDDEDEQMQRALAESLQLSQAQAGFDALADAAFEADMKRALAESARSAPAHWKDVEKKLPYR